MGIRRYIDDRLHFLFFVLFLVLGPGWGKRLRPARIREFIMKRVLLFMAALCVSSLTFAQVLVATLQHGDSVRVFYYANAFVDAYNAAVPGDVISLSAGAFTTCNIDKDNLTIRGAGMDQTFFASSFYLGYSNNSTINSITMEGIHCGSYVYQHRSLEVHFTNMYFGYYQVNNSGIALTGQFVNCLFNQYYGYTSSTPTLINCLVNNPSNSASSYINCVVREIYFSNLTHSSFINSVLVHSNTSSSNGSLTETALAQNCIGVRETATSGNIFSRCINQNSTMVGTDVFSNFSLDYMNPDRYILTDSAQAAYHGTDGTQVGLFGGFVPYTASLSYPVISHMNVAPRTTADGRLSVDIEVGYRQETEESNE